MKILLAACAILLSFSVSARCDAVSENGASVTSVSNCDSGVSLQNFFSANPDAARIGTMTEDDKTMWLYILAGVCAALLLLLVVA